ncbi:MAG TPA: hypothetical protein ENI51_06705 [Candidatus Atribacteria bacterium]|nr:hypothetical protein [Candidatus Atribacteria bacterium]
MTLVNQNPFLFHSTVSDNIAYGLKIRSFSSTDQRIRIKNCLLYISRCVYTTAAMPRAFLIPKMKKLEPYFKTSFSALSDFKELKNSEIYFKICKILNVYPEQIMHIGDHWEFDYLAACKGGLNALYLDRSNTRKKGKYIINSLEEVKKIIEDITSN